MPHCCVPRRRTAHTDGLGHLDERDGPPVVLLHGLTCHLGYWLRVMPLLAAARVVALDFGGHGLSAHRAVMPPERARSFAAAIPARPWRSPTVRGHHVELDAAELVARRILELARSR
jgi:pimeloyl-ACP methyl ester carboxylesterase